MTIDFARRFSTFCSDYYRADYRESPSGTQKVGEHWIPIVPAEEYLIVELWRPR